MPSRNHCQPLVDELVRVGLAHKYAHFTIIKVADFEFEVPLQGARVEVKIHGNEGEELVDNSCPTMLKATTWQKVVGRLRSEEHTSELQTRGHIVCRLLIE